MRRPSVSALAVLRALGAAGRLRLRLLVVMAGLTAVALLTSGPGLATAAGAPTVSNYTDPRISVPGGIAVGLDGALWFTNDVNIAIGRISTSGVVSNYTDPSIDGPIGIAVG